VGRSSKAEKALEPIGGLASVEEDYFIGVFSLLVPARKSWAGLSGSSKPAVFSDPAKEI